MVVVPFAESLLERLKLEQSLRAERERAQDRLPSRVAEDAVEGHTRKYARWLAGACAAGFTPAPQEIIWMPKGPLRYRPLSALPLPDRVVFRALADDLARGVTDLDAYQDNRDTFESDILEANNEFTHFGLADVASFYRYVPHSLLATRIVEATGHGDLASAVRDFLRASMQSEIGLPQNVGPSDQFADLVIGPVERRLLRRGFAVSRYNDDFRIAGTSNRSVRRGLESLQAELHAVGFTLNDSKTRILRRETFAEHVEEATEGDYEEAGEGDEPETGAAVESTLRILRVSLRKPASGTRSRAQELQALDRVRRALRRLTRWRNPSAIGHGQAIVNRYPSLTQQYGIYCATLASGGHGDEVAEYLRRRFPLLILTSWQDLWLFEPFIAGAQPLGTRLERWITARIEGADVPPMVRARASLAGATAGYVTSDIALRLVETLPEAARPDAIAAYAIASEGGRSAKKALAGLPDTLIAEWIFDNYA